MTTQSLAKETLEPGLAAEPLRALRRGLGRASGFALYVAVVKTPAQRIQLITLLGEALPGTKLQTVKLKPESTDILDEIQKQLNGKVSGPVMIVGLDEVLSSDTTRHPILNSLNLRRPDWPQIVPQPVVFWVPEYLLGILARNAPDFLDWRSDTLHFPDVGPEQLQTLQSAVWNGGLDTRIPAAARLERIKELESRIAANEHSHDNVIRAAVFNWLNELGWHFEFLGRVKKALICFEKCLSYSRDINDLFAEGIALCNLGSIHINLGDIEKSIEYSQRALWIDRKVGSRSGEGACLGNLGNAYFELGDMIRAREYYEQQLLLCREIGDKVGESNALGNLGNISSRLRNAQMAIEYYDQVLAIDQEIGDRQGEAFALGNLGITYGKLGDLRKALQFQEQSLAITRDIGDRRAEGNALWNAAGVLKKLGEKEEALARANAALKIFEEIEHPMIAELRTQLAEWRGKQS
jgi:tetratricopeptide (TPR) repeat protein